MDTYHQPPRYMRPPPPSPSVVDQPHPHHLHLQPPPRQPAPWLPGQFQYYPSQSPSPSPMPPHHQQQQQQWAPPPPPLSDHPPPHSYPPLPPPPYPPHPARNQFPPPPRPHFPPPHTLPPLHPSHPHSQVPQSFPQLNQEWGNPNWAHHQGWDYSAYNNEEDWAARARAWAAAKAATENQNLQSQFTPVGRQEEQNHYHDQYLQPLDPDYPDIQHESFASSNYQQLPAPGAPPQRPPVGHMQDSAPSSSDQSSYVPDSRPPFSIGDGTTSADSSAVFLHQKNLSTSPSIHQQEVPYSYSSVAGKEEVVGKNEQPQKVLPMPISLAQEGHIHPLPTVGTSVMSEQSFTHSNQTANPKADLSDQPLDFAPRFNRDHDPNMQSCYAHSDSVGSGRGMDPVAVVPSMHTWTPPVGSGLVYPPVVSPGPQHDPSITMPPIPGHAASLFGRISGPSFQQTIPSVSAPFGLGAGAALHPTTAFPVDAYNLSAGPERPKKASVPNWLREEIIKKKAVITSSSQDHPREETQFMEEDGVDKSFGKVDHADSKSIDSSRSTEEEDDDEDDMEASRTAAINQEIKRIVTEVLLKVTDELFDEIATKVLSEDDMTIEVDNRTAASNNKVSQISPSVRTPKASAKVIIPVKEKETEVEIVRVKSSSSSAGDVLGLASYASDDDDDDDDDDNEVHNFNGLDSQENSGHQQLSMKRLSEHIPDPVENGGSQIEAEERKVQTNIEAGPIRTSLIGAKNNGSSVASELSDVRAGTDSENGNMGLRTGAISGGREDDSNVDTGKGCYVSVSNECVGEKSMRPDLHSQNVNVIMSDSSQNKETRIDSFKNNRHETKRGSSGKNIVKEEESIKLEADAKRDENHQGHDKRNLRKDNTDYENSSKDRTKRQSSKSGEKAKDSDSRERTAHLDVKEGRKETEKFKRANVKAESVQKSEQTYDEKEGRSRHKLSGRHKRRRSSSISSRGRSSQDCSVISHTNASSDEASEDSKRKLHSRKSNLSPSPSRSRRRQVSGSPHSKHSQRRHSPYSSLEAIRGRSRSKSPVRRRR